MFRFLITVLCCGIFISCGKKESSYNESQEESPVVSDTSKQPVTKTEKPKEESVKEKPYTLPKPEKTISPLEANDYIGKVVIVKGFVADVYQSNKVAYLNFVEKYPRNPFTAVIFPDKFEEFGDLYQYMGKDVAVTGRVTVYKNKPQIILDDKSQVKVVK